MEKWKTQSRFSTFPPPRFLFTKAKHKPRAGYRPRPRTSPLQPTTSTNSVTFPIEATRRGVLIVAEHFCAELCIGLVEGYVAAKAGKQITDEPSEHIDYIFEKGSLGAGRVQTAFEEYYWGMERLWCRDFDQETKDAAELHAADIMAYEICKNLTDLYSGKTTLRHPLKKLISDVPHIMVGPGGAELAEMDRDLKIIQGGTD